MPSLRFLDVSHNLFSGTIPTCFGSVSQLFELRAIARPQSNLRISSPLPDLRSLQALDLLDISGQDINEPFPEWVGELRSLRALLLVGAELNSTIPDSLFNLTNLEYLFLPSAGLNGTLSPKLGELTKLKVLDLSGNEISGATSHNNTTEW
jgi:Leucine-rich repeat (LRR) protein